MATDVNNSVDEEVIERAVRLLREGQPVIFPTDTVYGIGCDIFNEKAVSSIFEIKKRDWFKPLTAHLHSPDMVSLVAEEIPDEFYKLVGKFLPGPLTVILRKKDTIPDHVSAGFQTIGVRIPDNSIFKSISKKFGGPVAATSANLSGEKEILSFGEASGIFKNDVPLIIDGGTLHDGIPSTIVSLAYKPFTLIRTGKIGREELEECLGCEIIERQ